MIQEDQLFCDGCRKTISLEGKSSLQLVIEIVEDSADRHYCEEWSPATFKIWSGTEPFPEQGV